MSFIERERDQAIDFVKFICSILVVSIHVKPFGEKVIGWRAFFNFGIQNYLARIAVPFFFISTGYFLYQKMPVDKNDVQRIKRYLLKIVRLYLIWSAIYFPINFVRILLDEEGFIHGFQKYIINFLFSGSYSHLWYLNATCCAVGILTIVLSKGISPKHILRFAYVTYFIGLFGQSWFGFIVPLKTIAPFIWKLLKMVQSLISTTRNGLFEGMLFVGIGMWIRCFGLKFTKRQAMIGFIISMFFFLVEVFLLKYFHISRMHDMYFCLVPVSICLFVSVRGTNILQFTVSDSLRSISTLVFLMHKGVAIGIGGLLKIVNVELLSTPIYFLGVVFITMICAIMIIKISKSRMVWLRKLYT